MIKIKCPVCGSENIRFVLKIVRIWEKKYNVWYCNNCHLYFLNNKPRLNEIINFYQKHFYNFNSIKQTFKDYCRYFRSVSQFNYINKTIETKNMYILEIGALDNLLLSMFKKNNKRLGTEYTLKYKHVAEKKYHVKLIKKNFEELKQKFDLIILSHVFEHFLSLDKTLKDLLKILKPHGYLFIEVPNLPTFSGKIDYDLDICLQSTHIHNFSKKNILLLFKKYKLKIVDISRFYYNISDKYSQQTQRETASVILEGINLNIRSIFPATYYFLTTLISPENSYKKINLNSPWRGLGDNLRIIVQR